MADYYFGEIPGNPVGTTYESREAAKQAGVHQVGVQGIAGNRHVGCVSIVLNGGYDTDEDYGHEIFYTGAGGQDPQNRKRHIAHQDLDASDNAALVTSERTGEPIRIIRGWKGGQEHSPRSGYRYDGLYKVLNHYEHYPADGFRRWMFHLVQLAPDEASGRTPESNHEANRQVFERYGLGSGPDNQDAIDGQATPAPVDAFYGFPGTFDFPAGNADPGARTVVTQRIIRDTAVAIAVKKLYRDACQVCGFQVPTSTGSYSEGAHIRPLGGIHHGSDTMSNILCLCPNHHAAFDKGGIILRDNLDVVDAEGDVIGKLRLHGNHDIDLNNVRYHRSHHAPTSDVVP